MLIHKKSIFTIAFIVSFSVFSQDIGSLLKDDLKRYPIESATIVFTIEGDAEGTATRYISSFGWQEKYEYEVSYSLYGMSTTNKKISMRNGLKMYEINPEKGEGKSWEDKASKDLLSYKSSRETKDAIFITRGGTKSGNASLLAKEVTIWKFENSPTVEIWEWEGIILKEVKKVQNLTYTITASKIDTNSVVEPEVFNLPEDIKLTQE